jgi:hypothetical protein
LLSDVQRTLIDKYNTTKGQPNTIFSIGEYNIFMQLDNSFYLTVVSMSDLGMESVKWKKTFIS